MTPRSLVFDLYGDYLRYLGDGEAPLGALSDLLELFGVEAPTTRVVMSRLRRDGWFETRRYGREVSYLPTQKAWALLDEGRDRIFRRRAEEWDGEWSMLVTHYDQPKRGLRDEVKKRLAWLGFGQLNTHTWMCPHPRLDDAAEALAELPFGELDLFTVRTRGLEEDRDLAARCWDLVDVQQAYLSFIDEFARPTEHEGTAALRRRVELVDAYRYFPFQDPDLPRDLCPAGWAGRRAHETFRAVHASLRDAADAAVEAITGIPILREASVPTQD